MLIVVHELQFHEHAFFDGLDKFPGLRGGEIFLFEPVGDGEAAAGLQKFSGRSKESLAILIVRDGFHGPQNVELFLEVHGFGVHQEEPYIEVLRCRGLHGHFELYGGNGYARDGGVKVPGQVETAGAQAAADVKNIRARLYADALSEMLDELKLGPFLGFIAANPIAVMQMLSPKRAIVRTKEVVVFDNSMLVVCARHSGEHASNGCFRIWQSRVLPLYPKQLCWVTSSWR